MINNPAYRQNWILDRLKVNPTESYTDMFAKYWVKFAKSKVTFDKDWNKTNNTFSNYQETINKAKLEQSIANAKKEIKKGLKAKFDRLMILQNSIDECLKQLTTKKCNDVYFKLGKPIEYNRKMNQRELNDTRKTFNLLQSEISKIEGDYAPVKNQNENVNPVIIKFSNE